MSMSPSCQRCGLTSSGPQAFLLTCRGCRKTWHHRCHQPPVEDQDLIQHIRATRSGDTSNDLSTWMCRRCKKRASETPSVMSSRETTVSSVSREDSKDSTSNSTTPPTSDVVSLASTADGRVKQESSTTVDARLVESRATVSAKRVFPIVTKRATSYRELSVLHDDNEDPPSSDTGSPSTSDTASLALRADVRAKQASNTMVDTPLVESKVAAPARHLLPLATKRSGLRKLETQSRQHVHPGLAQPRCTDAPMHSHHVKAARKFVDVVSDSPTSSSEAVKVIPPYRKKSPQRPSLSTHSQYIRAARKLDGTLSEPATSTEDDDVEMQVDSPSLSDLATPRASEAHFSVGPEAAAGAPHARAASSTNERGREVMPPLGVAIQPQVNQVAADEFDDDPEDLYGPPVERRIIRILPSLAEELREQQRRVAAEKEKRRVPLAPDWILARHVNDPLWKDIPAQGRKRRKPIARKLGENGLNVNDLMGCFTVQNWVREHKS